MQTAAMDGHVEVFPRDRDQLLPALLAVQRHAGWISDDAIGRIAEWLRVPVSEVEGVVTAYPELRRTPPVGHVVRVCTGEGCRCGGAERVLAAAHREETARGLEVEEVGCFFLCGVGPIVEVDGERYGRATEATMAILLGRLEPAS